MGVEESNILTSTSLEGIKNPESTSPQEPNQEDFDQGAKLSELLKTNTHNEYQDKSPVPSPKDIDEAYNQASILPEENPVITDLLEKLGKTKNPEIVIQEIYKFSQEHPDIDMSSIIEVNSHITGFKENLITQLSKVKDLVKNHESRKKKVEDQISLVDKKSISNLDDAIDLIITLNEARSGAGRQAVIDLYFPGYGEK